MGWLSVAIAAFGLYGVLRFQGLRGLWSFRVSGFLGSGFLEFRVLGFRALGCLQLEGVRVQGPPGKSLRWRSHT